MSKVAVIGMLAGGAFLFIVIIGLFISSFSGPAQAPQTGVDPGVADEVGDEMDSGSFNDGPFQGFDDGQQREEFRDESSFGFGGDGDSLGGERPLSTVDSEYGQLPAGEVRDDYVTAPDDKDSNGFVDFQQGAGGF